MKKQLSLFAVPDVDAAPESDAHRDIAARMPAGVHLGTSSWSFPGWAGIVYDRKAKQTVLAQEGLGAYAKHALLGCVGVDRTFYAPPTVEDLAAYASQVPDGFRFVLKAPQDLTWLVYPDHPRHGELAGQDNPDALDAEWARTAMVEPCVEGLGDKLGAIVFQFPPQRGVPGEGADGFATRLGDFLAALPRGPLYGVEIRTRNWLNDAYARVLDEAGAVHCVTVHPAMSSIDEQVDVARVLEGPALLVRWMLAGRQRYEEAKSRYAPFDRLVDPDPSGRRAIATLCRKMAEAGRPAYVTINNKAEGSAPLSAFALAQEIAEPS